MEALIKTNKGDMKVSLYTEDTPNTVSNFVKLINDGYYDGLKWHRVIPDFVIQGGCPNSKDGASGMPGTGGPRAMIAVFWDDLKTTNGGRVYTWFDEIGKKFYVEWSGVRTYQNNSTETFQAVLYDPSYYITPTGDGEILLQYKVIENLKE